VLGVGEEGVRQLVFLLELGVGLDRVRTDAEYYCVDSLEPREGVAKAARLDRSARGVVLRVEEEHDLPAAQRRERERLAFVGRESEVGGEGSGGEQGVDGVVG
jgi:hypothetical protein